MWMITPMENTFIEESTTSYTVVNDILDKLNPRALIRIKTNLTPGRHQNFMFPFHTDNPHHDAKTAIYYVNTCDGYTEFEDGTKTQCVANRLVKFPSNLKHRGVSQTDTRLKSVINLNFFTP